MANASVVYKYCFDGTIISQKVSNEWSYLMPYIKAKYTSTSSSIGQIVLVINADIASFNVNYPYAFDLAATTNERDSFGLSLAIMVKRLLTNVNTLKALLPTSTSLADTEIDANIRYSITLLLQTLTILETSLPVPCP